jgi:Peptidase family M1 domain
MRPPALYPAAATAIALLLAIQTVSPAVPASTQPGSGATSGPARSDRVANYQIDATLDPSTRTLTGREIVTWRNATTHPTSELRLHLYYNAWRNDQSSFLKSAALSGSGRRQFQDDDWGYCNVSEVSLLGDSSSPSVSLPTQFIQPDDGNKNDRTVLAVTLPAAVEPGAELRFEVRWELKIPRPTQRTGAIGSFFLLGQWFPKLGVFEANGTWNAHQFIETEFFADFGVYDAALTVPNGWVVGATGTRGPSAPNPAGGTTHRFHADDVHDFAWAASPDFEVHTDRFESPGLPGVDLELLLLPDHARLKERYFASTKEALRLYGTWYRPYAWDRITLVDPPYESNTGGMEYPMFVTSESRWLTLPENRLMEANTIHEVGHMWFQSAVANNEFEDAWLDEGLNTYAHKRVLEQIYRPSILEKRYFHGFIPFEFPDIPRAQPQHGADPFDGFRGSLKLDSLATKAYLSDERTWYLLPYTKGSLMLVTLERYLGAETMRRILATLTERYWFKHPRPSDFVAIANEVSGQDLSWYFDQVLTGTNVFDYAVDRVVSRPLRSAKGYGSETGDHVVHAGAALTGDAARFDSLVDIHRWGEGTFPIEIRVTFEDGSVAEKRWDGRERRIRIPLESASRIRSVEVDPRHVLVLDVNTTNNSWTSRPNAEIGARKWTAKWMIWVQHLLESGAFFS